MISRQTDRSLDRKANLLVAILIAVAFASRSVAALLLPNAEQDGYSYAEIIARLTERLQTGRLGLVDLYGFWLPLFQLAAASLNVCIHSPIVAGKIINVICGAVSVYLVFAITRVITASLTFALVAFVMILLNPLHLLYSAACMTDVPHGCAVLASLFFGLRQRWLIAAIFGAVAESIRIESWALLLVLPTLQWLYQRRPPLLTLTILVLPLVGWLFLTYAATGQPFAYFQERARYHVEYIQFHPDRQGFHWDVVNGDTAYLLLGAGKLVTAGAIVASGIFIATSMNRRDSLATPLVLPLTYWWAMLALLVLAYITKAQPVWLPRYGLTLFAVGLPTFAWTLQWCLRCAPVWWVKPTVCIGVLVVCLTEFHRQFPTLTKVRDDYQAHRKIANELVPNLQQSPGAKCFSDDVAIRVLSGLSPDRFLRSAVVPSGATADTEAFLAYLRNDGVTYLIYFPTEDSLPVKFFPELGRSSPITTSSFEMLAFAPSTFGPDIWLYRLQ